MPGITNYKSLFFLGVLAAWRLGVFSTLALGSPAPFAKDNLAFPKGAITVAEREQQPTFSRDGDALVIWQHAKDAIAAGRADAAVTLVQHLLAPGSAAMTLVPIDDGGKVGGHARRYAPLREQIVRLFDRAPPAMLLAYRTKTDVAVSRLLATPADWLDETKLREAAQHYFLSTQGRKVLYTLACLRMDAGDFTAARQWLREALRLPPPIVSEDHGGGDALRTGGASRLNRGNSGATSGVSGGPSNVLLLRGLIIADVRCGDVLSAQAALKRLQAQANVLPEVLAQAKRIVGKTQAVTTGPRDAGEQAGRLHHNQDHLADGWVTRWDETFALMPPPIELRRGHDIQPAFQQPTMPQERAQLAARQAENDWPSTARFITHDGNVYYKAHGSLLCRRIADGALVWEAKATPPDPFNATEWRFAPAPGSSGNASTTWPTTPAEVSYFANNLATALRIDGNTLYELTGDFATAPPDAEVEHRRDGRFVAGGPPNVLVARDADTGKLRWRLASDDATPGSEPWRVAAGAPGKGKAAAPDAERGRFLGLPRTLGSHLLVPFQQGGTIELLALDAVDGRVIWRCEICHLETDRGSDRWQPAAVATHGDTAYVATGRGVVAAVDVISGDIRWVLRYPRVMPAGLRKMNQPIDPRPAGWLGNVALVDAPSGTLLVLPSDRAALLGLDLATGRVRFADQTPDLQSCIGTVGGDVILAGPTLLMRCRISTGRVIWRQEREHSLGRPALADGLLYVPDGPTIRCLDPATGKRLATIKPAQPPALAMGNLCAADGHVLTMTLNEVRCLTPGKPLLAMLTKQVADGDMAARLTRARTLRQLGKMDGATRDFEVVIQGNGDASAKQSARRELLDMLLHEAGQGAANTAALLAKAAHYAEDHETQLRIVLGDAAYAAEHGDLARAVSVYVSLARDGANMQGPAGMNDTACRTTLAELAAMRLRQLARDPATAAALHQLLAPKADKAFASALASGSDPTTLIGLYRAFPRTRAGLKAMLLAAQHFEFAHQPEQATALREQLIHSDWPNAAATGWAATARAHEYNKAYIPAAYAWQQLAARYLNVTVATAHGPIKAGKLAKTSLAALHGDGKVTEPLGDALPGTQLQPRWQFTGRDLHLLGLTRGDTPRLASGGILVLEGKTNLLTCINLHTGKILWRNRLHQKEVATGRHAAVRQLVRRHDHAVLLWAGNAFPQGDLVHVGDVAVLIEPGRLVGLSLLSGKQLWTTSLERTDEQQPFLTRADLEQPNFGRLTAGDGMISWTTHDAHGGTVIHTINGATGQPLWTRTLEHADPLGLRIQHGLLCVIDSHQRRSTAYDARSGARVTSLALPGAVDQMLVPHWLGASAIFDYSDAQLRRHIRRVGLLDRRDAALNWDVIVDSADLPTLAADGGAQGVVVLDSGRLLVRGKPALLLDSATGRTVSRFDPVADDARDLFRGAALVDDGNVLLRQWHHGGDAMLRADDAATGQKRYELHTRSQWWLTPTVRTLARSGRRSGGWLPSVREMPASDPAHPAIQPHDDLCQVPLLDGRTGKVATANAAATPLSADWAPRLQAPPRVQGGYLLVVTKDHLWAYR